MAEYLYSGGSTHLYENNLVMIALLTGGVYISLLGLGMRGPEAALSTN